MQKFTIFTIIFSIAVISIMAELVINNYLETNNDVAKSTQASLLTDKIINEEETVPVEEKETTPKQITTNTTNPQINNDSLEATGLKDVNNKNIQFNGKLFQLVELPGLKNEQVLKNNFFEGQNFVLTSYEIHFGDSESTSELYTYVKEQSANKPHINVNESNSFGDNSIYVNNSEKKNTVFLVVKINTNLYAFEYTHKYHPNVKSLLETLKPAS